MHLQRYYSNLFVSVILETKYCHLFAKVIKNRKTIKTYETIFDNEDEDNLDKKVLDYIKDISNDYNETYIAFYLNSIGQGAFQGDDFKAHSVDFANVSSINLDKKWTAYASYIDVNWAKDMFKPLGLDLLYSPFVFIYHEVKKREIDEKITLYILNHEDSFAMGIFKQNQLLYGSFFKTHHKTLEIGEITEDGYEEIENETYIDSFDDMENEEYASLDDLDDTLDFELEDNLSIDEINEDEDTESSILENHQESIEFLGRDMTMYKYIVESIKEFYSDKLYEKNFIDKVVVFDNHEITSTLVNMIKDELLLSVEVEKIDTLKYMCDIAIKDINL